MLTLPVMLSFQSGESIMVEVAAGPSDSATHEKVSSPRPVLLLLFSSAETQPIVRLTFAFSPASHGAQSAEVKLLTSGSL